MHQNTRMISLCILGGDSDNSLNASGNMAAACPTPPDSPSYQPTCPFFTGELDSTMELFGIKAAEGNISRVSVRAHNLSTWILFQLHKM